MIIGAPIKKPPAQKPAFQNPFHIPNAQGNDVVTGLPAAPPQSIAAPAAVAAPVAAPAPIDFNALAQVDPLYTQQKQQIAQQNQLTLEGLARSFHQNAQGAQDNANAHGALFSGAAVNAQRSIGQGYADQTRQQALNTQNQQGTALQAAFQRLIQQFGGTK